MLYQLSYTPTVFRNRTSCNLLKHQQFKDGTSRPLTPIGTVEIPSGSFYGESTRLSTEGYALNCITFGQVFSNELLDDCCDDACTDGTTTFTDSKAQAFIHGDRHDQFNIHRDIIARHHHLSALRQ